MPSVRDTLSVWLQEAANTGARYMLVVGDRRTREAFPVFIATEAEYWERYNALDARKELQVIEVYDLARDWDSQIEEYRAFHPPSKPEPAPGPDDPRLAVFREFIETLDLSGFGEEERGRA